MRQEKQMYVSPLIEVIEVENEGVIAASVTTGTSTLPGVTDGNSAYSVSSSRAAQSDIEDLIDDILTIEQ